MIGSKVAKCAMINAECPRNNDPANGRYCPHWGEFEEENSQTGERRIRRSCDIPVMMQWMKQVQQSASLSGKVLQVINNERIKQGREQIPGGQIPLLPLTQGDDR